jgi:hypothetical protein
MLRRECGHGCRPDDHLPKRRIVEPVPDATTEGVAGVRSRPGRPKKHLVDSSAFVTKINELPKSAGIL